MFHYKIGNFECDEGDKVNTCYGPGKVVSPDEAVKRFPDCSGESTRWVYINLINNKRILGLVPDVHEIIVVEKSNVYIRTNSDDICKKCGGAGQRFPMCCRCSQCGEIIWGI